MEWVEQQITKHKLAEAVKHLNSQMRLKSVSRENERLVFEFKVQRFRHSDFVAAQLMFEWSAEGKCWVWAPNLGKCQCTGR
jgi:hypothetical protein